MSTVCCSHSAHSRRFIKKFAGKRRPLAWLPVHSTDVFFTMNYKHPKTFSGIPCCCLARSLIPPSHFPLFVIFTYFSSVKLFFPSLSCRLMTCAQKPRNTCTHWVSEKWTQSWPSATDGDYTHGWGQSLQWPHSSCSHMMWLLQSFRSHHVLCGFSNG